MTAIYAIGSNGSGQLGIGHKEDVSVPKNIIFEDRSSQDQIVQIKAGGNHSLLLSCSGILYGSGDPTNGSSGLVSDSRPWEAHFRKIRLADPDDEQRIVLCAATWEASIIVQKDESGLATKVHSFGTGNKGEMGLGEFIFRSSKAQLIKDFPPPGLEVVDLAASVTHAIAVMSNGDVYGWGNGRKGQIGEPTDIVFSPRRISGLNFKVVRAACGREFTYLLGESRTGEHMILGSDKWGVRSTAPLAVPRWKEIGASWGSIFVLQEDGKLLSWGRNDHGQLTPSALPTILKIAIGSEHALGLTLEGDVLAWGWGEHGNCGPKTVDGDVKGRWNIIASSRFLQPGCCISTIGAGYATSWICISTADTSS
ncbi:hypothetical protein B7494_g6048 [Chlorociboria aeruginascens]|nr:hypothetical protein B7494_g6048 [Chlorociboria aeruginascens]